MADAASAKNATNSILAKLSEKDFALLEPYVERLDLPVRTMLEKRNKRVEHVYFIDSGMVSIVSNGKQEVEVGVVGREGMTGVSVVLGSDKPTVYETYVQIAGSGRRVTSKLMRQAMGASPTLSSAVLAYTQTFLAQVTQTAAANARGTLDQRLSRWLLLANDRVDGDIVPLTHEFLAVMLGVNRPGVTLALQELERTGSVAQRRGAVIILDRTDLESIATGIYIKP
jgi:CRP-like cAMP-binding protein